MKYDNDGFNMWQIIILMILANLISFAIIGPIGPILVGLFMFVTYIL